MPQLSNAKSSFQIIKMWDLLLECTQLYYLSKTNNQMCIIKNTSYVTFAKLMQIISHQNLHPKEKENQVESLQN